MRRRKLADTRGMAHQNPLPHRPKPAAWRRWLGVTLRSAHLMAVCWLAAALLGAAAPVGTAAAAMFASGLLLLLVELADRRLSLRELAGAVVLAKIALSGLMAWQPQWAAAVFWPLVFVSSLASHAPKHWRHWPTPAGRDE
jgi:hypothetical protein